MDMPTAPWQLRIPFGHKARHDSKARSDLLCTCLEQDRTIRGFERFAKLNRNFIHARPGLGMQSFDRYTEGEHFIHECGEEVSLVVHA